MQNKRRLAHAPVSVGKLQVKGTAASRHVGVDAEERRGVSENVLSREQGCTLLEDTTKRPLRRSNDTPGRTYGGANKACHGTLDGEDGRL